MPQNDKRDESQPPKRRVKRPYQRPRIVVRESIEAMATSCLTPGSKPDPVLCPIGPIQS